MICRWRKIFFLRRICPKTLMSNADLELMCTQLLKFAEQFYEDPENKKAYEAWKAKEANLNEDHDHH